MREDTLYRLENENEIASPALIYYPEIIRRNVEETIRRAGSAERLWPHVKTHKMAEMVRMQMEMGIRRFKCATVMELAMTCECGAEHALLAYPLLGPNVGRFLDVAGRYLRTTCYAMGESMEALTQLEAECARRNVTIKWLCDVNMGMDRTGVSPDALEGFCRAAVDRFPHLELTGFHCYDGHNHQKDFAERQAAVAGQYARIKAARAALQADGIATPIVIAGGSPSFPCYVNEEVFLSPGTVFVWDWGYQRDYEDLTYTPGAALLTRVISHPARGVFTLDLGSKAIASDPAGLRGRLLESRGAQPVLQNEEHWTWRMPEGHEDERPAIGEVLYVIPTHICPTSALYRAAKVAGAGRVTEEWVVTARNRD